MSVEIRVVFRGGAPPISIVINGKPRDQVMVDLMAGFKKATLEGVLELKNGPTGAAWIMFVSDIAYVSVADDDTR